MSVTKTTFKKYIKSLDEESLQEELIRLYDRLPLVKEYYKFELSNDSSKLVDAYKEKISRHYFPKNRTVKRPKAAFSKELIRTFQRLSPFPFDTIDLLLHQVEVMIRFSEKRGMVSTGFQSTLLSRYKEALKLIKSEGLKADFMERCQQVLIKSRFMRWGTYDALLEAYIAVFNKKKEAVAQ